MAVGRAVINTVAVAINQDLKALICNPRLHPKYLLFFLTHKAPELEAKATGATVKGITIDEIESLNIPIPNLSQQRRIAGLLEQADRLRRTRRYALELSDAFLPAVFRELFGDPIKNDKDWHVAALGEYIDFLTSGSRGWASYYAERGDAFIRIQNVGRGRMLLDDLTYVVAPRNAEATRTLVKSGDVLLSITADLGRSAAIPDGFPPAFVNQHLAIIRQTELNPVFLATLLSCDAAQAMWGTIDRAAVKSGLNFDDIRGFHVITPPMSSQQHFAELVARHELLKAGQREALRQADHFFYSLLHRAFNGVN
jgi:type I restriction enzyme S subunit